MPDSNTRRSEKISENLFVLLTWLTSVFVLSYSYKSGGFYNDNLTFFAVFRDNAFSLNRFGEPAWWLPHINFGQPGHIPWELGPQGYSPATMLFGLLVWLLGAAGYMISDFRYLYVAYLFILVPTIFMACMWVLTSQFQNRYTRLLLFAMGAFSPVLIQSVSDPGMVETAAYSLLCVAAVLRYLKMRGPREFYRMVFAFSLLLLSLKFTFVFWGIPFLLMLLWAVFGTRSLRKLALRVITKESKVRLAIGIGFLIVATLPFLNVWREAKEFANPVVGARYDLKDLVPGNPLQPLLLSTPGVTFEWDLYRPSPDHPLVQFFPRAFRSSYAFSYAYMGLLCLPLILVGLVYGRKALSSRLAILGLTAFTVIMLSGFSPFYALFVLTSQFMLANNHYSDEMFQAGACLIPMFLAGLGFDRIMKGHKRAAKLALRALLPSTAGAIALLIYLNRGTAAQFGTMLGFSLMIALLTAYALYNHFAARTVQDTKRYSMLLVTLVLIDVATISYWQIRTAVTPKTAVKDLSATTPDSLEVIERLALRGAKNLLVRKEQVLLLRAKTEMKPLVESADAGSHAFLARRTFNEMTVRANPAQPTTILIRDAWDPHWTATLNGKPTTLQKAGIFKSIAIPAGPAEIKLRFSPTGFKAMLALSYLALLVTGVLSTGIGRRRRVA